MREFKAQQGFLTIAQNSSVDYLRLAYLQALCIKTVMPSSRYAVVVDFYTEAQMQDKYLKVFDYVIPLANDMAYNEEWKLANEWQVFELTPFKETIKLESDLLLTRTVDHWWSAFRLHDVVLSSGCKTNFQTQSFSSEYRRLFNDNDLPDIYNGLMYFRYSRTAAEFFDVAKQLYTNWDTVRDTLLINCRDSNPTTDVVYALAAKIIGVEYCTMPSLDFINFTHMKPAINGWANKPWHEAVFSELDLPMLRIHNTNQYHPIHYHDKSWVTDDIITEYEYEYQRRIPTSIG